MTAPIKLTALLIGGMAPALFLGLGTVLLRASVAAGASIPAFLGAVGTTIALIGWGALLTGHGAAAFGKATVYACAMGVTWSLAIACIAYGFGHLKLPVSLVAPLTNSNALIAVCVGAIAFAEWKHLNMVAVGLGALLIFAGAVLVCVAR